MRLSLSPVSVGLLELGRAGGARAYGRGAKLGWRQGGGQGRRGLFLSIVVWAGLHEIKD